MGRETDSIWADVPKEDRAQYGMAGRKRQGCLYQTDWGHFMSQVDG